ncbi:aminoglycoside phosphotransferase family protein [Shimia sediminis]|uniref:aminoglycoside phosphotransferase family protein n=1 Tax=Shimia sediminis TaxID=2497945 RepID=UPI000F8F1AD0|nr:phosphotransferase [Shimia sediminis]
MTRRAHEIDLFLAGSGWHDAKKHALAGDASNRRYLRLSKGAQSAVLMDAPPSFGEDVRPFVRIANWLRQAGFSAPEIYYADEAQGFLLLEDLGDDLIARVVEADDRQEQSLYGIATDVLAELHATPAPDLIRYTPDMMADMIAPVFDWYLMGCGQDGTVKNEFMGRFRGILDKYCSETDVVILRDYHAENLLWLPSRTGVAGVGLLDFQDALLGHRAYDLVSLLHDIRRDVSQETEQNMIRRYLDRTGLEQTSFEAAFHALGVQRNLRIMGVFTRLCLYAGKPHYIDYLPRVWRLILRELEHPALDSIRQMALDHLPEPTPALIRKLKNQCATIPTP